MGMLSPRRQDVQAECVVLSRTTWLTVIFQSRVCCTALAPVGSEDPVGKHGEAAGSWYPRSSPVLDAVPPPGSPELRREQCTQYPWCHLGALLWPGLLLRWPYLGHYVMAAVSKGTDGSSAGQTAQLTRTLLLWGSGKGTGDNRFSQPAVSGCGLYSGSTDLLYRAPEVFY